MYSYTGNMATAMAMGMAMGTEKRKVN
jgi:hypothetical protein